MIRRRRRISPRRSSFGCSAINNLALNAIRDRKRKPINNPKTVSDSGPLGARPLEQLIPDGSGAMPSRVFAKGELASVVRNAVGLLPEDQRLAVVLNKFEDMSYREIADIMGRSEMAIKSLLSRARTALRDVIEPYISGGKAVRRTDGARATGDSGAQAAAGS
jgi:RNA polymerase sigma-70 factor (ECF subfamily)